MGKEEKMKKIFLFAMTVIIVSTIFTNKATAYAAEEKYEILAAEKVVEIVNNEREAAGLKALKANQALLVDAGIRAEEITQKFSHTRPDGSEYWTVDERRVFSENLLKGAETAEEVVDLWMNSPHHKANILGKGAKNIGISILNQDGTWYVSMLTD